MDAIYDNAPIGSPVYQGLTLGGVVPVDGPFVKANYPGLRAIRVNGVLVLAADLDDSQDISEIPGSGEWKNWTPTYSGITIGSGTVVARYVQVGKTVHCYFYFLMGSGSAITSPAQVSTPVPASSSYPTFFPVGVFRYQTTVNGMGYIRIENANTFRPVVMNATGTYLVESGVTNTIPGTWASTHRYAFSATYEAA